MSLIRPRPIRIYYTVAPVQMADKRVANGGYIIDDDVVARRAERKGFSVLCVCVFAWVELSLVGLSPNHVCAYTTGPGFLSCVVVRVYMDPLGDRIRR